MLQTAFDKVLGREVGVAAGQSKPAGACGQAPPNLDARRGLRTFSLRSNERRSERDPKR